MILALTLALATSATAAPDPAVARGVDWLVARQDALPVGFDKFYRYLYRLSADDALADRLYGAAVRANPKRPRTVVPLGAGVTLPGLQAAIEQLYQVRCSGTDSVGYERQRQVLRGHRDRLFGAGLPANQRIVTSFLLRKVDLGEGYEAVASEIRRDALGVRSPLEILMLTHVVFTRSDYFARYPDAAAMLPEAEALRAASRSFAGEDAGAFLRNPGTQDLVGEVLSARKLLRMAPDATSVELERRLRLAQNPDGSWGSEDLASCPTCKVHHTLVAVQALAAYPATFRARDAWCDADWR